MVNTPAKTSKRIARRPASFKSLRLLTRHTKSTFWNTLDGHCVRWSGVYVLTAGHHLGKIGFCALKLDPCVYVYENDNGSTILTLYVDDVLLTTGHQQAVAGQAQEATHGPF